MDINEPVTVFTLSDPIKAEIIKNSLAADGIRCMLDGINQAGEAGLTAFEIKVQVAAKDADLARRLIEQHERHKQPGKQYETRR
ncbi:MAG: DUF2007 domain-containing protein [Gemmataceae bacterium]|nr:DUF2007 domain-containing protein [Gemmataceae bacterium]